MNKEQEEEEEDKNHVGTSTKFADGGGIASAVVNSIWNKQA